MTTTNRPRPRLGRVDWQLVGLGVLVAGLAGVVGMAFRVSWGALRDIAVAIGLDPVAASVYPVAVDALIALALITSLVLAGSPRDRRWALAVLGIYTAASLILNYVHGLHPDLHGLAELTDPPRVPLAPWTTGAAALIHPALTLLASALPVASIFFGSELVSRVCRHTLARRPATAAGEPDAVAETVQTQVAEAAEAVAARLDASLAAFREQVDAGLDTVRERLDAVAAGQVDTETLDALVDARAEAKAREHAAGVRAAVEADLRGRLDAQGVQAVQEATAAALGRLDARVDTTVREQLRVLLPDLTQDVTATLRDDLHAYLQQTTVRPGRRELHGRATTTSNGNGGVRAAIETAYLTNPDPEAWSKRRLAEAAGYPGSTTVAQRVLEEARRSQQPPADADTPDAGVHPEEVQS